MSSWEGRLSEWGYPRAGELAPLLRQLGLDPSLYSKPQQLSRDLLRLRERGVVPLEWWGPIADFLNWLWKMIQPYALGVGLIGLGAFMMWAIPGDYKVIGLAPIGGGLYLILRQAGMI